MKATRGFTLLELLVVISIIGLLSSIVFASVRSARTRAADTNIRANLVGTRAEADLFYSTPARSYNGVCALTGTNVIGDQVQLAEMTYDNQALAPGYADGTASRWDNAQCHDTVNAWAAWVPLKGSASGAIVAYCVDSTGAGKQVTAILPAEDVAAGDLPAAYACP